MNPPMNFYTTKESPCDKEACPWNCPCLGEATGCPIDGRHQNHTYKRKEAVGGCCGGT